MIPDEDYEKILDIMPICCVDVVVVNEGKYLLVKRNNEPAKKRWWIPGGRLFKNESIQDCALRKAKEEAGLECTYIKTLGLYETIFERGRYDKPVHSVNVVCLLESKGVNEVQLDKNHLEFIWNEKIDESLNKDIKRFLEDAGFEK